MPNQPARNPKSVPKAVRMPTGLLGWYKRVAPERGQTVNALLVEALEEKRQREEQAGNGATTRPGSATTRTTTSRPRKAAPAAARIQGQRGENNCTHPPGRRLKSGTYCGACGKTVSDEKQAKGRR